MPKNTCGYLKMTLTVRKEMKECFGVILNTDSNSSIILKVKISFPPVLTSKLLR